MLASIRALPITRVADCKSLRDTMHKDSGKLPQEKRLIMDFAWLREAMQLEAAVDPRESTHPCDIPTRWVPTDPMLADVLTKEMDLRGQYHRLVAGFLHLPRDMPAPEEEP
eukprot:4415537-Pyramimonas_sp.AAC.1